MIHHALIITVNHYLLSCFTNEHNALYFQSCCITRAVYGMPYKYLIKHRKLEKRNSLLMIDDFSKRWLHGVDYNITIEVKSSISNKVLDDDDTLNFSYASLLGEFSKSMSFYC